MITTGILGIVYAFIFVITAIFRATPIVSLPSNITSAVSTAGGYIAGINTFVPIGTITAIFGIFLAYEFAYFTMKLINWVIRKIPGIS